LQTSQDAILCGATRRANQRSSFLGAHMKLIARFCRCRPNFNYVQTPDDHDISKVPVPRNSCQESGPIRNLAKQLTTAWFFSRRFDIGRVSLANSGASRMHARALHVDRVARRLWQRPVTPQLGVPGCTDGSTDLVQLAEFSVTVMHTKLQCRGCALGGHAPRKTS
jgi:hypothetical protein